MANSTPAGIVVEYDDSGGVLRDITQYVLTINDIDVEMMNEEVRPFGLAWEKHLPIGVGKVNPIELGGLYDDVANGPNALFIRTTPDTPASTTRTFKITWKSGKTTEVETWMGSYKRTPNKNELTKYTATLQPTLAPTEA
jgi:hypothetical protein